MKVSVLMPSYNHEFYIAEAIDSFLAQECSFDIELLIGDDRSTDNTLSVAQEYSLKYSHKIKLIAHSENQGLLKNYQSLINIAQGEYLAVLESDDYWTDPQKLQKQVDFLDANPSCGISFTRWERLRNGKFAIQPDESKKQDRYKDMLYESYLLWKNKIRATTVVFRRSLYDKYCNLDDYIELGFQTIDYPVFVSIVRNSTIHYIPYSTAVYRILKTSISHNRNWEKAFSYQKGIEKMRQYIITLYGKGNLSEFQIIGRETYLKFRMALRYKKYRTAFSFLFLETIKRSWQTIRKAVKIGAKDIRDFIKSLRTYSWFGKSQVKPQQTVVLLVDGKYSHGGFCDRFKGIISLYSYALANNLPFRIEYTFPFKLADYLLPNQYNWLPKEGDVSQNYTEVKYICLVRDPSVQRLLSIDTKKQIHSHANRDIVKQLNAVYHKNYDWGTAFNELFQPTKELADLIAYHKANIGAGFISAHFRFINLFGDFKDNRKYRIPDDQRERLIETNLQAIRDLRQKNPSKTIFVAADSNIFVERAAALEGVYTLEGNIVHIDYVEGETRNTYMRVFLDFFMLTESERIFAFGTKEMYQTQFPLYAAKVNNIPFERIKL